MRKELTEEEKKGIEFADIEQQRLFEKLDEDVKNMVIYDEQFYGETK